MFSCDVPLLPLNLAVLVPILTAVCSDYDIAPGSTYHTPLVHWWDIRRSVALILATMRLDSGLMPASSVWVGNVVTFVTMLELRCYCRMYPHSRTHVTENICTVKTQCQIFSLRTAQYVSCLNPLNYCLMWLLPIIFEHCLSAYFYFIVSCLITLNNTCCFCMLVFNSVPD